MAIVSFGAVGKRATTSNGIGIAIDATIETMSYHERGHGDGGEGRGRGCHEKDWRIGVASLRA